MIDASGRVHAEGRRDARIAIVAEAPATEEIALGRPLVGPSGRLWMRWLDAVGLQRRDLWIDNVYPFQAPDNKIANVDKAILVPWLDDVQDRVAALDDPWLLVPMGGVALRAFYGESAITKWRGSILSYTDRRGRTIKMVPVIHPAAIFKQPYWEGRCRADWRRIALEAKTKAIVLPARSHFVEPTLSDCRDFAADVRTHRPDFIATDIETPRERIVTPIAFNWSCDGCGESGVVRDQSGFTVARLPVGKGGRLKKALAHGTCGPVSHEGFTDALRPRAVSETVEYGPGRVTLVGFADSPMRSLTIPTTLSYWKERRLLDGAWDVIRTLWESAVPKTLQFGHFDAYHMKLDHGITLNGWLWDSGALHHCLDPVEDHDLAFLGSVFTREPYWKDDIKAGNDDLGESDEQRFDPRTFAIYNGKDCCTTWEITSVLIAEAIRRRALDRFIAHYRALFRPLLDMMVEGVAFDRARAALVRVKLLERANRLRSEITATAGVDLFGKSGALSPLKLKTYLYETLKLPKQFVVNPGTKKKEVTTREVAIRTLAVRYPDRVGATAAKLLAHRETQKRATFFDEAIVDSDNRVRCSYRFTTEAMRLSSSKNPKRTGLNLQNQPNVKKEEAAESPRAAYIADPGHLWMKIDGSQIESRIVDVLTKHPDHVERARSKPWEYDAHSENASRIFGRLITKTDKVERDIGKKTTHMAQRDGKGAKLAEVLLCEGIVRSASQCQGYLDRFHAFAPGYERLYFPDVRRRLLRDAKLTNVWGDEWIVTWERLNDDLFRRGYSFGPQSNAARWTNNLGIVPLSSYIKARGMDARLRMQVHDEINFSFAPGWGWELWTTARASLEREVDYEGVPLSVPAELSLGTSWATTIEFARPPAREEFEAAIATLVREQRERDVA